MVYKKSFLYRNRRAAPRWAMNNAQQAVQMSAQALKISRNLKGIVNSELHSHDVTVSSVISSTGTMTSLCAIAQSDDQTGRTGRSILAKSIEIRQFVNANSTVAATNVRQIIFMDSMNQGADPAPTELLVTDDPNALRNVLSEKGRFKVLWDSQSVIPLSAEGSHNAKVNHKFINLGNHHIFYEGTTAGTEGKGALFLYQVTNLSTLPPGQSTRVRLRFYDN